MPVTRQVIVEKATFVAVDDEIERATREKKEYPAGDDTPIYSRLAPIHDPCRARKKGRGVKTKPIGLCSFAPKKE